MIKAHHHTMDHDLIHGVVCYDRMYHCSGTLLYAFTSLEFDRGRGKAGWHVCMPPMACLARQMYNPACRKPRLGKASMAVQDRGPALQNSTNRRRGVADHTCHSMPQFLRAACLRADLGMCQCCLLLGGVAARASA